MNPLIKKRIAQYAHFVGKRFVHSVTGEAVFVFCIAHNIEYGLYIPYGAGGIFINDFLKDWKEESLLNEKEV